MNILEILKKCPIGTKLYSPICGECKLHNILLDDTFSVISGKNIFVFFDDGRYIKEGECCIFPSKYQRDWNKFQIPFKNGDIISYSSYICIFKKEGNLGGTVDFYCGIGLNGKFLIKDINNPNHHFGNINVYRLATKKEKEKLFQAIKNNGYKWNSQTKTLEKLIKDKFDISTLKPFDKVLVRNYDHEEWDIEFFARRNDEKKFETLIGIYNQCIPYKGNEHLLHKTDDCDNYYKIW